MRQNQLRYSMSQSHIQEQWKLKTKQGGNFEHIFNTWNKPKQNPSICLAISFFSFKLTSDGADRGVGSVPAASRRMKQLNEIAADGTARDCCDEWTAIGSDG